MREFITYFAPGLELFSKDKIVTNLEPSPMKNNKPTEAWWGSPVDAEFGWKDWCENEEWYLENVTEDKAIHWYLDESAKILQIRYDNVDDPNIPWIYESQLPISIDWYEVSKQYDAVELMDASMGHRILPMINETSRWKEFQFNSWDCQSLVILNPEKIIWETK